jgi:hypothetical protein
MRRGSHLSFLILQKAWMVRAADCIEDQQSSTLLSTPGRKKSLLWPTCRSMRARPNAGERGDEWFERR